MVVKIDTFVVAPQRKLTLAVVGHVGVLHLFAVENKAARQRPERENAPGFAGFTVAANVFIKAAFPGARVKAVVEEEAAGDVLAEMVGDVPLVMKTVGGRVVLLAADQVEAGVEALWIGAVCAWFAEFIRTEFAECKQTLRSPAMLRRKEDIVVAVIRVFHGAVRKGRGQ